MNLVGRRLVVFVYQQANETTWPVTQFAGTLTETDGVGPVDNLAVLLQFAALSASMWLVSGDSGCV
jgi:hypothetical protein